MQATYCTLNMKVPVELRDAIVRAAKEENRPTSQVILDILQDYVRRTQANAPMEYAAMVAIVEQGNDTDGLIEVAITTDDSALRARAGELLKKMPMTEQQQRRIKDAAYSDKYENISDTLLELLPISASFAMGIKQAFGSDMLRSINLNYTEAEAHYGTDWLGS